jgi:AsmA protein
MPRRRRRSAPRPTVILLAVVLLIPVLAMLGALVFVHPNAWRPEVEAAVQRTTGRVLRIGRLAFVPSFSPTLSVTDLALANLPGGSRPDMITVAHAEAKLALLPLLAGRIEIARLLLIRPDILLERDAAGRPNWRFGGRPAAAVPAQSASPGAPPGSGPGVLVRALRIEDARVTWQGKGAAAPMRFDLHVLEADASGVEAPVMLTARAAYAGQEFAASVEAGPLSRLFDAAAATPWPVKGILETPGARLTVAGALTHPLNGDGYALSVQGAAVNLSALDGLLATRLPPLRQVAFAARVVDDGGHLPEITGLAVRAGASDLDTFVAGLKLAHAELSAAALGEPVRAEATGSMRGVPLHVTAALGPLIALLSDPPKSGPYPIELAAETQGATLAVKGGIGTLAPLSGIDLAVTGRIPDLSALGPLVGTVLPALQPVTLDARVAGHEGTPGFAIRGLAVTAPEVDISGELVVGLGPRPMLQASLSSRRIDLDAMLAALPSPAATGPAGPPPASMAAPPRPLPKHSDRLVPDDKLPFARLDGADADLHLAVGELRSGGISYRDFTGRLLLQDGKLMLDPFSATLPGGRMDLKFSADSRATPPSATLVARVPGVPLKPLMAALHLPDGIAGTAAIDADLRGAGDTLRALAAGLGGRLGLAMADADLDNRLLGSSLTVILNGTQLPTQLLGLDRPGRTRIRCLALRADADDGIVTVSTALIDAGRVLVHGTGMLNLRDESIALRLRSMLRVGIPVVVPVRIGGTFRDAKIASDLTGAAGAIASERNGDACAPALAAARGGSRQVAPSR